MIVFLIVLALCITIAFYAVYIYAYKHGWKDGRADGIRAMDTLYQAHITRAKATRQKHLEAGYDRVK